MIPLFASLAFWLKRRAGTFAESTRFAPLAQELDRFVAEGQVAGGVALIAVDGQTRFLHAFGLQDRENGIPATPSTIFHLTSLTKPVTAAAAMTLMDERRLSLEDPISKFLPAFDSQLLWNGQPLTEPIRIRHIMTHSSGLIDAIPEEFLSTDYSLAELIDMAAQQPLGFAPGERWAYANLGFDVLGRIIEIVSGQTFHDFVRARILGPLRMKDSFYGVERRKAERIAAYYAPHDGQLVREPTDPAQSRARFIPPSHGLHSTASDLARFFTMLLNQGRLGSRRVLSLESAQAMVTSQTGRWNAGFIPGSGYGLGCSVITGPEEIFRFHSPGTFGHGGCFQTHAWVDPERRILTVILCQQRCFELPVAREVAAFLTRSVAVTLP